MTPRAATARPELPDVELRPQAVLLTFFGDFVAGKHIAVSTASVVDVLEGAGVGSHAARATLTRMVRRGLLHRVAQGRQAYFGLTEFGRRTVASGRERAQTADVVTRDWDGSWTLVSFSLSDDAQRERHDLRSRLIWAGFGLVQGGLWAAPRDVDVAPLIDELGLADHVNAFRGQPLPPTDARRLVAAAYDVEELAARYEAFLDRWRAVARRPASLPDPLVARVVLSTDWSLVLRGDPRLPVQFLPRGWPGLRARDLHQALDEKLREPAAEAARARLDLLRLTSP